MQMMEETHQVAPLFAASAASRSAPANTSIAFGSSTSATILSSSDATSHHGPSLQSTVAANSLDTDEMRFQHYNNLLSSEFPTDEADAISDKFQPILPVLDALLMDEGANAIKSTKVPKTEASMKAAPTPLSNNSMRSGPLARGSTGVQSKRKATTEPCDSSDSESSFDRSILKKQPATYSLRKKVARANSNPSEAMSATRARASQTNKSMFTLDSDSDSDSSSDDDIIMPMARKKNHSKPLSDNSMRSTPLARRNTDQPERKATTSESTSKRVPSKRTPSAKASANSSTSTRAPLADLTSQMANTKQSGSKSKSKSAAPSKRVQFSGLSAKSSPAEDRKRFNEAVDDYSVDIVDWCIDTAKSRGIAPEIFLDSLDLPEEQDLEIRRSMAFYQAYEIRHSKAVSTNLFDSLQLLPTPLSVSPLSL